MTLNDGRPDTFDYDVALSFAGEQRIYVEQVAAALRDQGRRPFYDDYERAELWGKDLYEHLAWIYQKSARFCVLFASTDYAQKVWTTHERRSAQARAMQSAAEYILPVKFDDTEIPGLLPTVMFIDGLSTAPADLADLIIRKLGPRVREKFFPPHPDRLINALDATDGFESEAVDSIARSFMQTLTRMTIPERRLVAHIFAEGCRSELPENIHISLDLIRRDLGVAPSDLVERLRAMVSLGFESEVRSNEEHDDDVIVLTWDDMTTYNDEDVESYAFENSTQVAVSMLDVGAGDEQCRACAEQCVESLDFSLLSSATRVRT